MLKCRDHNHFTGKYRGAACSSDNSKARLPKNIVIYFHNGGGFDFHFLIRAIADLQGSEIGNMTLHEFYYGEVNPQMPMKFKDLQVNTIAKSSERYMQLSFGSLVFRDSLNLIKSSLGKMIDSQRKVAPQAEACLLYTSPSPRDRTRSRMPSSA